MPFPSIVGLACVCAFAGLFLIHDTVGRLAEMWRTDDLKSMGLVVPFVAAALILRAWRSLRWRVPARGEAGPWWGVALLLATAMVTFWRRESMFLLTVHGSWTVQLPPFPVVAMLYATAMTLIFGGVPLLRRAWFGVALMLLVIPVPAAFSSLVDLPLQHASATVARGFAHLLGEPLTQDKLRLMFTPEYGMFIAPGCNGIRGAVTLGLAALVVGYLYRFRAAVYVPVVAGAVLLGYLFNFVRLCLLVVYYKLSLGHPWFQYRARGADSWIGGTLFVGALWIFFAVANRLRRDPVDVLPDEPVSAVPAAAALQPLLLRAAIVLVLAAVFAVDMRREVHVDAARKAAQPIEAFPQEVAGWTLVRTWNEMLVSGVVVYAWAEYRQPAALGGAVVDIGISPTLGLHDVTVCHLVRGETAAMSREMDAPTSAGTVPFSLALYNDGETQHLEASTTCEGAVCRQFTESGSGVTLVYSRPRRLVPLGENATRPVPVLLVASTRDLTLSADTALAKLSADVRAFVAGVDLAGWARGYEEGRS